MKKYILIVPILFSLLAIFCGNKQPIVTAPPAPTDYWSSTTSTSFFNHHKLKWAAANGYFTAISSIPDDSNFVTKVELPTLVCIDQTNSYYTALPYSSSFVEKRGATSSGTAQTHSGTLYFLSNDGWGYSWGWASSTAACTHSGSQTATIYWNGTFANGITLYGDVCGTTALAYGSGGGGTGNYFFIAGQYFSIDGSNHVSGLTNCSGGLTDVYVHVSAFTPGSQSTTVTTYSDAGNTTTVNTDTNVTVTVYFEDLYGNTWTATGVISSGTHTVTFNSGLSGSGYPPNSAYVSTTSPTSSSTQNYIPN